MRMKSEDAKVEVMTREDREAFVGNIIATTGAHGAALDAIVSVIVNRWTDDADEVFDRGISEGRTAGWNERG